ncbi:hypothetical protein [Flavobacterium sandaracinum]|uniref:Uncharacterized protein n=1 Tax=Flavobacterium sandaracinum TaxID=2541733 RepID=A0A4R5D774_9FLAO|nr:hypothetical protein [Flavobacterium sandaracinum]TDE06013.1 hypothetical protein E0F91_05390 [Flavobacterium sandaracinum]
MSKSYVKCLACNTINVDRDYCSNCGEIINIVLKRQLESEDAIKEKVEEEKSKVPSKIEVFFDKGLGHSNSVVRFFFQAVYSIWLFLAVVIGGIIAAVTAAAAG